MKISASLRPSFQFYTNALGAVFFPFLFLVVVILFVCCMYQCHGRYNLAPPARALRLLFNNGWHHLFFVEKDTPTQFLGWLTISNGPKVKNLDER